MNDDQKKALLLWHSWGHCAPGNPILAAAAEAYLHPLGMKFDYVEFDPSGLVEGHFPTLSLVHRRFQLRAATDATLKDLFAPLAPVMKHLKVGLHEPFYLAIELMPSAARDEIAYQAAKAAMDAGLEASVNSLFAAGLDAFRITVSSAFTSLLADESQAKAVPAFLADPVAYYHEIRLAIEAAATV